MLEILEKSNTSANKSTLARPSLDAISSKDEGLIAGLEFLWLEITNQCNLRCSHCYAESGPAEPRTFGLLAPDWIKILREARTLGCKKVQFIGGEPTLHPYLCELIEEAHALRYDFIEVFTNGTRTKSDLFDVMRRRGVHLATSFYSSDAAIHDQITTVRGSYSKTVRTIRQAVAFGIPIRVGIIEMEINSGDTAKTIEFLKGLGVNENTIARDRVRAIGRGTGERPAASSMSELCGRCWRGSLAINSAGEIAPCIMSHFSNIGHVDEGLAAILQKDTLRQVRNQIRAIEKARYSSNQARELKSDPDDCNPYCNPNCNPFDDCSPQCIPPCGPFE
jgi:MoaA/NifB/PqqE/SkfB family radical SAM enzyme